MPPPHLRTPTGRRSLISRGTRLRLVHSRLAQLLEYTRAPADASASRVSRDDERPWPRILERGQSVCDIARALPRGRDGALGPVGRGRHRSAVATTGVSRAMLYSFGRVSINRSRSRVIGPTTVGDARALVAKRQRPFVGGIAGRTLRLKHPVTWPQSSARVITLV